MLSLSTLILATALAASPPFYDDFEDGALGSKWFQSVTGDGVTLAETGGRLQFTTVANTELSVASYVSNLLDATESLAHVEMVQRGASGANLQDWALQLLFTNPNSGSNGDYVAVYLFQGYMQYVERVNGVTGSPVLTPAAASVRWLRLRATGGNIVAEYSSNGSTWSELRRKVAPFAMNSVRIKLSGSNNTKTSRTTSMALDNFYFGPIPAASPTKLAFTTASRTFRVSDCGGVANVVTVQRQDVNSVAHPATDGAFAVTLSSSQASGAWFKDSGCTEPVAGGSFEMPRGAASLNAYYRDPVSGARTFTATASGLVAASQSHTVIAGSGQRLEWNTAAQSTTASACPTSSTPMTVQVGLRDAGGNATVAGAGGATFTISSSSSTGLFYRDGTCNAPSTDGTFTIPSGANSVNITYRDTRAGNPVFSLSNAAGLNNAAAQMHVVAPAAADRLLFTTPSRTFTAHVCSGPTRPITIALQDAFGNPAPAPAGDVDFFCDSTSGSGRWFLDADCQNELASTDFRLLQGATSGTWYYLDTSPGTVAFDVTVASPISPPAAQMHDVVATRPGDVVTLPATGITSTSALLNGQAIPAETNTTAWFEYGTTSVSTCVAGAGQPAPQPPVSLGTGSAAHPFSHRITGLTPETTYYVCTFATTLGGTTSGNVLSFTTPARTYGAPTAANSRFSVDEGASPTLTSFGGRLTARIVLFDAENQSVRLGDSDTLAVAGESSLRVTAVTYDLASNSYSARVSMPSCPSSETLSLTAKLNGETIGEPISVTPRCETAPTKVALGVEVKGDAARVGSAVSAKVTLTDERATQDSTLWLVVHSRGLQLSAPASSRETLKSEGGRFPLSSVSFDGSTFGMNGTVVGQDAAIDVWLEDGEGVALSEAQHARVDAGALMSQFGCDVAGGALFAPAAWALVSLLRSRRRPGRG